MRKEINFNSFGNEENHNYDFHRNFFFSLFSHCIRVLCSSFYFNFVTFLYRYLKEWIFKNKRKFLIARTFICLCYIFILRNVAKKLELKWQGIYFFILSYDRIFIYSSISIILKKKKKEKKLCFDSWDIEKTISSGSSSF